MNAEQFGQFIGALLVYLGAQLVLAVRQQRTVKHSVAKQINAALTDDSGKSLTVAMTEQIKGLSETLQSGLATIPTISSAYQDIIAMQSRAIDRASDAYAALELKNSDILRRLDETTKIVNHLQTEVEVSASERVELKQFNADLIEANKVRDEKNVELTGKIESMQGSLATAQHELEETRRELDKTKLELESAKHRIEQIEQERIAERTASNQEKQKLLGELNAERAKVTELEKQVKSQQARISQLEDEIAMLKAAPKVDAPTGEGGAQ